MSMRGRAPAAPSIALPIETPRLILRDFRKADLDAVHAYSSLEDVARYLIWGPNTLAQSKEAIEGFLDDQRMRPRTIFDVAVTLKPKRDVIGGAGLRIIDKDNLTGEIGYTLHPDFWGYGLAVEAARALLDAGFNELGLQRIVAVCDQRNKASARVMERLGMRREGVFRGSKLIQHGWRDEYLYAILAEEFS
ncbi:MAG TPA: GNAT family N-acetyltransferase [Parvibaculum sp.]|jgi:RimJ/RimL family protein N-acetyltransferase